MSDLRRIDHLSCRLSPLIFTSLRGGVARRVDQRMHERRFDRPRDDTVHTDAFVHQVVEGVFDVAGLVMLWIAPLDAE